jgi:hypothetical protein
MRVKARDGNTYEVASAPPGGSHEVSYEGDNVGSFVLHPDEPEVTVKSSQVTEVLLVDIAERFVASGGGPEDIA